MVGRPGVQAAIPAVLLILCLIAAGCTSIPGPEPRKATATPTPTPDIVPMKTMRVTTTLVTATPTVPVTELATPSGTRAGTPAVTPAPGTYELRTCAQLGGTLVTPGGRCPGTWLSAPDTFSCCSEPPVSAIDRNASITAEPLDLDIPFDDDPGRVLP